MINRKEYVLCETQEQWDIVNANIPEEFRLLDSNYWENYKEKTVKFDSGSHLKLLKSTLEHLLSLRDAYANGSATRHIISQTCTRLKRLINKLEK